MTASKDGVILLWKLDDSQSIPAVNGEQHSEETEFLQYLTEAILDQETGHAPITKVRWFDESTLVASTKTGQILQLKMKLDSQQVPYLEKPTELWRCEHSAAIWDIVVFRKRQALICALDSGQVICLDLD